MKKASGKKSKGGKPAGEGSNDDWLQVSTSSFGGHKLVSKSNSTTSGLKVHHIHVYVI